MIAQIESHSVKEACLLEEYLDNMGYTWPSGLSFLGAQSWKTTEHQFFHLGVRGEKIISRGRDRHRLSGSKKYDFDGTVMQFLEYIDKIDKVFDVADDGELTKLLTA